MARPNDPEELLAALAAKLRAQKTGMPRWAFVVAALDLAWTIAVLMIGEAASDKILCLNTHPPRVCGDTLAIWIPIIWIGGLLLFTALGVLVYGLRR